ncbi:hypothetical protein EMN47_12025 [Prolixibacteraceae bacterium JC049]|nr:hypothetical protein [Prolixibacteraceae bacterium JC049]
MPKTHVKKSIVIVADSSKILDIISDFNHWEIWSPWLKLEPGVKVTVSENGKKQQWDGKRIGAGIIEVISERESQVDYNLTFLKPWKSMAKTSFIVKKLDDSSCELTWTMDGSLPFFMFWMKAMMERLIGMDYARGLFMLKEYIETGSVTAQLEFIGQSNYPGCNFVGVKSECTIDNIGEVMHNDFVKLSEFAESNGELVTDTIFSMYHKFDFNKNRIVYTTGIGVKSDPENMPNGFIKGTIPSTPIYTVRHVGPYQLSGNAWSSIMAMERAKEFKKNKKIPPMEFYRNSPLHTDPKDLISDICMPIK